MSEQFTVEEDSLSETPSEKDTFCKKTSKKQAPLDQQEDVLYKLTGSYQLLARENECPPSPNPQNQSHALDLKDQKTDKQLSFDKFRGPEQNEMNPQDTHSLSNVNQSTRTSIDSCSTIAAYSFEDKRISREALVGNQTTSIESFDNFDYPCKGSHTSRNQSTSMESCNQNSATKALLMCQSTSIENFRDCKCLMKSSQSDQYQTASTESYSDNNCPLRNTLTASGSSLKSESNSTVSSVQCRCSKPMSPCRRCGNISPSITSVRGSSTSERRTNIIAAKKPSPFKLKRPAANQTKVSPRVICECKSLTANENKKGKVVPLSPYDSSKDEDQEKNKEYVEVIECVKGGKVIKGITCKCCSGAKSGKSVPCKCTSGSNSVKSVTCEYTKGANSVTSDTCECSQGTNSATSVTCECSKGANSVKSVTCEYTKGKKSVRSDTCECSQGTNSARSVTCECSKAKNSVRSVTGEHTQGTNSARNVTCKCSQDAKAVRSITCECSPGAVGVKKRCPCKAERRPPSPATAVVAPRWYRPKDTRHQDTNSVGVGSSRWRVPSEPWRGPPQPADYGQCSPSCAGKPVKGGLRLARRPSQSGFGAREGRWSPEHTWGDPKPALRSVGVDGSRRVDGACAGKRPGPDPCRGAGPASPSGFGAREGRWSPEHTSGDPKPALRSVGVDGGRRVDGACAGKRSGPDPCRGAGPASPSGFGAREGRWSPEHTSGDPKPALRSVGVDGSRRVDGACAGKRSGPDPCRGAGPASPSGLSACMDVSRGARSGPSRPQPRSTRDWNCILPTGQTGLFFKYRVNRQNTQVGFQSANSNLIHAARAEVTPDTPESLDCDPECQPTSGGSGEQNDTVELQNQEQANDFPCAELGKGNVMPEVSSSSTSESVIRDKQTRGDSSTAEMDVKLDKATMVEFPCGLCSNTLTSKLKQASSERSQPSRAETPNEKKLSKSKPILSDFPCGNICLQKLMSSGSVSTAAPGKHQVKTEVPLLDPNCYQGNYDGVISVAKYEKNKKRKKKTKLLATDVSLPVTRQNFAVHVNDAKGSKLVKGDIITWDCKCVPIPVSKRQKGKLKRLLSDSVADASKELVMPCEVFYDDDPKKKNGDAGALKCTCSLCLCPEPGACRENPGLCNPAFKAKVRKKGPAGLPAWCSLFNKG